MNRGTSFLGGNNQFDSQVTYLGLNASLAGWLAVNFRYDLMNQSSLPWSSTHKISGPRIKYIRPNITQVATAEVYKN